MPLSDGELNEVIRVRARDGRLSCADALDIAKETRTPTRKIGQLIDEMGIKIVKCQLGCFD